MTQNEMTPLTRSTWEKFSSPPEVLATMQGQIVGKAVSTHPGQPVTVTVEITLPNGFVTTLPLVFPSEADTQQIPDSITQQMDKEGQIQRTYNDPTPIMIMIVRAPGAISLEAPIEAQRVPQAPQAPSEPEPVISPVSPEPPSPATPVDSGDAPTP